MSHEVWKPSKELVAHSNMKHFMNYVNAKHHTHFLNYQELYIWSITYPEEFWIEIWNFCQIKAKRLWDHALLNRYQMAEAKWFTGATLNFAENLLRRHDEKLAIVFRNEKNQRRTLTYAELYNEVAKLATALQRAGVKPKDRIVGFLPNIPETVIAMLATTAIGATWSSCSPDFGTHAILDRFGQIEPKILFTTDGYFYNGKTYDDLVKVQEIANQLPTLQQVIVIPYMNEKPDISHIKSGTLYEDFLNLKILPNLPLKKGGKNNYSLIKEEINSPFLKGGQGEISFSQFPFDQPIYIMYSSGTTGVPKCIGHSAGGTLLQHLKELMLHTNVTDKDNIFYYTTCGWMMWNWLVSSLATGATVILYDGSPFHPEPNALFNLIDEEKITIFGTSAKYISAIEKANMNPMKTHSLDSLKTILSTGLPLLPENFDFVYKKIKHDVQLSSISGGTDIISCFVLGNPLLPVFRGELQSAGLGMKVEIFDEHGEPIQEEKGELVCSEPFPSMPIYFWNDPEGKKYHKAYFEKFPGVWAHGDYAQTTEHNGFIIYGRSDATLKPHGIRLGTAEIYREVEKFADILESIAVGQEWENDVRVILFVKLREDKVLSEDLKNQIKNTIKEKVSPHHVPAKIIQVKDIPRTVSGKIVELAVREVIHERPVKNIDALANPEALEYFKNLQELKD